MSYWYEVFDNEQELFLMRRRAAQITGLWIGNATLSACLVLIVAVGEAAPTRALLLIPASWAPLGLWTWSRLRRLRRSVWCLKVSDRHVVGYDYQRRKTTIDWTAVRRVDLQADGLTVANGDGVELVVSAAFPAFSDLSHRIAHYAELYEVPLFLDGFAWQALDVYRLFPFLAADAPNEPPSLPH